MKTRGETLATVAGVAIVAVGLLALACTREPTAEQKAADRAKLVDARNKLAQETTRMARAGRSNCGAFEEPQRGTNCISCRTLILGGKCGTCEFTRRQAAGGDGGSVQERAWGGSSWPVTNG